MSRMLKDIDQRLERYGSRIEPNPAARAGTWADTWLPGAREVRLDLGCGRGGFTVESALREPDVLFVGIDSEVICVACAARGAIERGVSNAVFACADASWLAGVFDPGELARIYMNFSTPFPRKKFASSRLTYASRLSTYRHVLAPGGFIDLRTDSLPYRDFSLTQFELGNYRVVWSSDDLRADAAQNVAPSDIAASPVSEYEARLTAEGARVYAMRVEPPETAAELPPSWEKLMPMSLVDYLPSDLEQMSYVPYGMEACVLNLRNRRAKAAARKQ